MIKTIGGASLEEWEAWAKKELKPPLSDKVAEHPHVLRFLEVFCELIRKVKIQNHRVAEQDPSMEVVFLDLLSKDLDTE